MQTNADERRRAQTNVRQTASSVWADATSRHVQTLDVCSRTFGTYYMYVAVYISVPLSSTESIQAIHGLLLHVVNRLDVIEPRISVIEQNALLSIPPSPAPSYASSFHDEMALYSPLTRQATSLSLPPVPMLPPAQPGPSYKPASCKQLNFPMPTHPVSSLPLLPLHPPVSPTKLTLKPVDVVIRHNSKLLNPTGIRRLATALACESVFGPDILASNKLREEGLLFIEQTLRHLLPGISDLDFSEKYWTPSQQAIKRACDCEKASKKRVD